jgi:hypothetical protein
MQQACPPPVKRAGDAHWEPRLRGGPGAGKRIDVFATALWNNMRADEMMQLDLAYAPPFGPVWDPVLIAARKAWEASRAMP